jgi:hypothetical protein
VNSYRGVLLLLLQNHVQFKIVTPRTLDRFRGKVLVLPNVRVVSEPEVEALMRYAAHGGKVVVTGTADKRINSLRGSIVLRGSAEVDYLRHAEHEFSASDPSSEPDLLKAISASTGLEVRASRNVVVHEARIGNRVYLFFANFDGLQAGVKAAPVVQPGIEVRVPLRFGNRLHWLPFMGTETTAEGKASAGEVRFTLPDLDRGAVAWFASTPK